MLKTIKTQIECGIGLPPLAAFTGGVVAQEVVKIMTQKFMPTKQLAIFTCSEILGQVTSIFECKGFHMWSNKNWETFE
jgi:hypothetical protein